MTGFEGWDDVCPYTYEVTDNNAFIVYNNGNEVHRSRAFRLRVQAETQAQKWITNKAGKPKSADSVLDVQTGSIGPGSKI